MHVFVCSNSWLDVGYGAKLQEYLLKNSHVRAVYESAIDRQFSTAQINTIISIIENSSNGGSQPTKFISLRDINSTKTNSRERLPTRIAAERLLLAKLSCGKPDWVHRTKAVKGVLLVTNGAENIFVHRTFTDRFFTRIKTDSFDWAKLPESGGVLQQAQISSSS